MATVRITCPSCEATVLLKDPKLIGSKVECPKCKYRFKAEAPAAPPPDAAPAPSTAADPKADKKKGKDKAPADGKKGKKKLLIGVGVGLAAVALLAIGGFVLFGGGDDKKTAGGGGGPRPSVPAPKGVTPTPEGGNPEAGDGKAEGDKEGTPKAPPAPPLVRSDKEVTNLLPNDAVAVYRFHLDKIRTSPVGQPLLDPAMTDLLKTSTGLQPAQLEKYIHCVVGEKDRAAVGVLRLKEPVAQKDLTGRLTGVGPAQKVGAYDLHPVAKNPFFVAVGNALAYRSLLGDVFEAAPPPAADADQPLGACAYDTQHLLVGDYAALERFLGSLKADGYPEFRTEWRKDALPPPPPGDEEKKDEPAKDEPAKDGATPAAPPKKAAPAKQPLDFSINPTYLSVSPELKRLLNGLEENPPPTGSSLILLAEKWDNAAYARKGFRKEYEAVAAVVDPVLAKARYVGATLWSLDFRRLTATVRVVGTADEDMRTLAIETVGPGLLKAAPAVSLLLSNFVQVRNYVAPDLGKEQDGGLFAPGGAFGAPGGATGVGPAARPGGLGTPGTVGGGGLGTPGAVGGGGTPPFGGAGGYPSGGMGGSSGGYPSGYGGASGMRPGGEFPGGGSGGDDDDMGGPGGRPGMMMPPGGMMPGMMPGGMMPGGMGPGGAAGPRRPDDPALGPQLDAPHVDLRLNDNVLTMQVELNWPEEVFAGAVAPRLFGLVNQVKGKAAVYAGEHTWHSLAGAVSKYVAAKKAYPAGTFPSGKADKNRLQLPYEPVRRVSFFAELLPYLGRGGVAQGVDPKKAWFDDQNVIASESWIPELLVPYYPPAAWRANSPLAPAHTFGGTNYVAVAGVGTEAARYDPKNPAHAKLVGITGYDWGSKVEEVADGPANTIYLLQVPPGLSRPWAAGGGATVMGLDPKDPMAAVKHPRGDGQEGTYAIMGDGTVRWLPAKIDPKVFLAMATRAGGEKLPNLDEVAPRVELPTKADAVPADAPKPAAKPAAKPAGGSDAPVPTPAGGLPVAPEPREKAAEPAKE